ncbi:6763_t:CDS:2, partial [Acaulospora colombiana]
ARNKAITFAEIDMENADSLVLSDDPQHPANLIPEICACIHTHSQNAVMVTLLYPGGEFVITHQEMIKGIRRGSGTQNLRYDDTLVVPIIENTPFEEDLAEGMAKIIEDYPDTNAVLVRRHGVYVWGETWEKAKTMSECYDYLFEIAIKMRSFGLDPAAKPDAKLQI